MILKSIDGKTIYYLIINPFKQIGKMPNKETCIGCTHHDITWDKLERKYSDYCWLFGVWHDEPKPNNICKYNIRNKSNEKT